LEWSAGYCQAYFDARSARNYQQAGELGVKKTSSLKGKWRMAGAS